MDDHVGRTPGIGQCLLCYLEINAGSSGSTPEKCKMFEALCCFLGIILPEEFCWNFQKDEFPFCKSCTPFLEELRNLFEELERLHGRVNRVFGDIIGVFTPGGKDLQKELKSKGSVSKFEYLKKKLEGVFSTEEDGSRVVLSPPVGTGEDSGGDSWVEVEVRGSAASEAPVAAPSSEQREPVPNLPCPGECYVVLKSVPPSSDEKRVRWKDLETEVSEDNAISSTGESADLKLFCSGVVKDTVSANAVKPSNPPSEDKSGESGECRFYHPTGNEVGGENHDLKFLVMENGKRIRLEEEVPSNSEKTVQEVEPNSYNIQHAPSRGLYFMEEGSKWEQNLVLCPKPPWTAIFSSHGFTYAGISVLSAEKGFQCSICSKTWKSSEAAIDHVEFQHLGFDHWYPCTTCRRIFRRTSDLQHHIGTSHPEKPLEKWNLLCVSCKKRFSTGDLLFQHLQVHSVTYSSSGQAVPGRESVQNSSEGAAPSSLRSRYPREAKEKKIDYSDITRKSKTENSVYSSMQDDSVEACSVKEKIKELKSIEDLRQGQLFFCGGCGYQAYNSSESTEKEILQHVSDHLGDKTFQCMICREEFSTLQSILSHELAHFACFLRDPFRLWYVFYRPAVPQQ